MGPFEVDSCKVELVFQSGYYYFCLGVARLRSSGGNRLGCRDLRAKECGHWFLRSEYIFRPIIPAVFGLAFRVCGRPIDSFPSICQNRCLFTHNICKFSVQLINQLIEFQELPGEHGIDLCPNPFHFEPDPLVIGAYPIPIELIRHGLDPLAIVAPIPNVLVLEFELPDPPIKPDNLLVPLLREATSGSTVLFEPFVLLPQLHDLIRELPDLVGLVDREAYLLRGGELCVGVGAGAPQELQLLLFLPELFC